MAFCRLLAVLVLIYNTEGEKDKCPGCHLENIILVSRQILVLIYLANLLFYKSEDEISISCPVIINYFTDIGSYLTIGDDWTS